MSIIGIPDDDRIHIVDIDLSTLRPGDILALTEISPVKLYSRDAVRTAMTDGVTMAADEANISSSDDRFVWAHAAAMTLLDKPSANWATVRNAHYAPGPAPTDDDDPQYTRDQVSQAVNNGIDLAAKHERRTVADDLDNLIVNAALTLLDDPDADFHKVATENYDECPSVIRSWL
ncbi:hypothetical protein [Streptomyces sp. NEAU-174]|uniref:hypothetical protein n=1 Tax=Streptomyces sp. NEAU-174 TaxID=3458254 RepID=UPI004044BDDD